MIGRHVRPNIIAPIIILATVNLGAVILIEAALSFLGFGVPPPRPSWGGMLSGAGLVHMLRAPWLARLAGGCARCGAVAGGVRRQHAGRRAPRRARPAAAWDLAGRRGRRGPGPVIPCETR